jgi:hypothetical protein
LPRAISSTTCFLNASLYRIAVLTLVFLLPKVTTYFRTGHSQSTSHAQPFTIPRPLNPSEVPLAKRVVKSLLSMKMYEEPFLRRWVASRRGVGSWYCKLLRFHDNAPTDIAGSAVPIPSRPEIRTFPRSNLERFAKSASPPPIRGLDIDRPTGFRICFAKTFRIY